MARRRKGGDDEGGANWMDTYGDMITLVLTFFVLLYSMSSMDQSKWQYIATAFSRGSIQDVHVPADKEPNPDNDPSAIYQQQEKNQKDIEFDEFYMYLEEVVKSNELQDNVSVEISKTGVYLRFRDNVFFEGDSAELREEGEFILDIICGGVKDVRDMIYSIKVSGYTASTGGFSTANEWNLSSDRANSVINFMLDADTCDEEKFSSAGYGRNRPIADNSTEDGRAQNRRVEIVFVRNDIDFSDPEIIQELLQLEFGEDFVTKTNEGEPMADVEEAEPVQTEREYVSRDELY